MPITFKSGILALLGALRVALVVDAGPHPADRRCRLAKGIETADYADFE